MKVELMHYVTLLLPLHTLQCDYYLTAVRVIIVKIEIR